MNKKSLLLFFFLIFTISTFANHTTEADSIKVATLPDVVVEGDREYTNQNITTYMVGKEQREHSSNGIDLLKFMAIPQLIINPLEKKVTTLSNENVAFYINGLPADDADVANLYCMDAVKVEFIQDSTDTKFQGHRYVVNFILKPLESGGYTRFNLNTTGFRDFSYFGSVYSKFNYKKVTYDFNAGSNYYDIKQGGENSSQRFLLTDNYESDYYVYRNTDSKNEDYGFKRYDIPLSFRISYSNDKIVIRNSIRFAFNDILKLFYKGQLDIITPDTDGQYEYSQSDRMLNRVVGWDGYYLFTLPKGFSLSLTPAFKYSARTSGHTYHSNYGIEDKIVTNNNERNYTGSLNANLRKTFGVHNLSLKYIGDISHYKNIFTGNSPYKSNVLTLTDNLGATYNYYGQRWQFICDLSLRHTLNDIEGNTDHYITPGIVLIANYSPTNKHQFSICNSFSRVAPMASTASNHIFQINEFLWAKGTENLRTQNDIGLGGYWTFLPSHTISFTLNPDYMFSRHTLRDIYTPYLDGKAVLRSKSNNGDFHNVRISGNLALRLLSDRLSIGTTINYRFWKLTGDGAFVHHFVDGTVYASYIINAFNINVLYRTPGKYVDQSGLINQTPNIYTISAGWTNPHWNITVRCTNPFAGTKWVLKSRFQSDYYSYHTRTFEDSYYNNFDISVSYTFGYGKRLPQVDEVDAGIESRTLSITGK